MLGKLCETRTRLYRSRLLQVNARSKALDEIYKRFRISTISFAILLEYHFFQALPQFRPIFGEHFPESQHFLRKGPKYDRLDSQIS